MYYNPYLIMIQSWLNLLGFGMSAYFCNICDSDTCLHASLSKTYAERERRKAARKFDMLAAQNGQVVHEDLSQSSDQHRKIKCDINPWDLVPVRKSEKIDTSLQGQIFKPVYPKLAPSKTKKLLLLRNIK